MNISKFTRTSFSVRLLATLTMATLIFSLMPVFAQAESTGVTVNDSSLTTEVNEQTNFVVTVNTDNGSTTDGTFIEVTDNGAGGEIYGGTTEGECNDTTVDTNGQFAINQSKGVCYSNSATGTYAIDVQLLDGENGSSIGSSVSVQVEVTEESNETTYTYSHTVNSDNIFIVGVQEEFSVTTNTTDPNNDNSPIVRAYTTTTPDANGSYEYKDQAGNWQPFDPATGFGPAGGFEFSNGITSEFRVIFPTAGDYTSTTEYREVGTDTVIATETTNFTVVAPTISTSIVEVKESDLQGWEKYNDSFAQGGKTTFVADSTAPRGDGALQLETGDNDTRVGLYNENFDLDLNSVQLTYDSKQISADDIANGNATIRIGIDTDTDGELDDQLMYEPYYNGFNGNSANGQDWQTWTIDSSTGKVWSNNSKTYGGEGGGSQALFNISDVLAEYPSATIVGISFSMGTYNDYQIVNVDNFTIQSGLETTIYDFESEPAPVIPACESTDSVSMTTFDTFNNGTVDGQQGWSATGAYDEEIVDNIYGYESFGCQSLRVSNAVTSGSFGDWVFSAPIGTSAGESSVASENYFEATFDIATAVPGEEQPNLQLSVSPDDGTGARMSYLRFNDESDGIHVFFNDYFEGAFRETDIDTLDRSEPHTVKFVMEMNDGPSNDIVEIYIDDELVHTGTTWEDFFRDSQPTISPVAVDSLLIQARTNQGEASETENEGFLFDNMSLSTDEPVVEEDDDSNGGGGGTRVGNRGSNDNDDEGPEGEVLGVSTSSYCPYLNESLQLGETNSSWEVTKLQMFLDIVMQYDVEVTGVFDTETDEAVKRFQENYKEEILDPWFEAGIVPHTNPTGFVYRTTNWKMTDLICPGMIPFPDLSGESLATNVDNDLNE